jgi:hypothetical protein
MRIASSFLAGALLLVAQTPFAMAQRVIELVCPRLGMQFASCVSSTIDRPFKDRIGLVGNVTQTGEGAYDRTRLSVEIVKASTDRLPSSINIEIDRCLAWKAPLGTEINVYIWQRATPNGAYLLADCPN